jgi:hypothetical protein
MKAYSSGGTRWKLSTAEKERETKGREREETTAFERELSFARSA